MKTSLKSITIPKDSVLFREGDPASDAYLISKGKIEIYRNHGGKRFTLELLTSGKLFGEMALLTGAPRSASAMAAEETTLVVLDTAVLEAQLERTSPYLKMLMDSLIKRVRLADEKLVSRNIVNPVISIARLLHALAQADGREDFGVPGPRLKKKALSLIRMTEAEFDTALSLLVDTGLIDRQAYQGRKFMVICDMDTFLKDAARVSNQLNHYGDITTNAGQFADILDAAAILGKAPEAIVDDIASGKIPQSGLLFHIPGMLARLKDHDETASNAP